MTNRSDLMRQVFETAPDAVVGVFNIQIDVRERGKLVQREETHNIVTNIGSQFLARTIVSSTAAPTITRHDDSVVRYIGFGIGGHRQNSPIADAAPFSVDFPGVNTQTDTDLTVAGLQRPVTVIAATPQWVTEIAAPATFPTATSVRFTAVFSETDINDGYASVPLSEIGLFTSAADPSLPNGAAGVYPGSGGLMIAYDTFHTIHKTGIFSLEVMWEFRF